MGVIDSLKALIVGKEDNRRARRIVEPHVAIYYWNGAEPVPHRLRDVSRTGAYMETAERWYPGTTLQVTLDLDNMGGGNGERPVRENTVTLWAKVVRHGPDGVGLDFVFVRPAREVEFKQFLAHVEENAA